MDPHLLRTFVTVVEAGSFSAAAGRLGYTQSAVSQHIAVLEADLGTPLLYRRPVAPTHAGARLLEHAGPILLRLQAARADVARAATVTPARLVVAASPLAASRVADALAAVRRAMPGAEVSLHVTTREAVVAETATATFDLGLVDGVAAPSDPLRICANTVLSPVVVAEDRVVVMLPVEHPLARRAGLRLDDLADARWIDAPDTAAPLADLRAATGTDGLPSSTCYHGTDTATLVNLVARGHGLAVLPLGAVRDTAMVASVPVVSPRLVHRVELLHGAVDGAAAVLVDALAPRPGANAPRPGVNASGTDGS